MASFTNGLCLGRLTDEPKGIERLAFIRIVDVFVASQIGCEELSGRLDGALNDHVVDRCLGRCRYDSVDRSLSDRQSITKTKLSLESTDKG